jgi:hypothetical protein
MTFTQIYAAIVVPVLAARTFLHVARLLGGARSTPGYALALMVLALLAYVGWEVEWYYFREVKEGKDKLPWLFRFLAGLPVVYGLSLLPLVFAPKAPLAFLLGGAILALGIWFLVSDGHHRGRRVFTQRYYEPIARKALPPGDQGIPFGGLPVATERTCTHTAIVGTTGSGKTTALKHRMAVTLERVGKSPESMRALIYDPKTELYGFASTHAKCEVLSLHPFERRSHARGWAVCLDVRDPKAANQLAFTFIPKQDGPNAYFSNSARAVLEGVVNSFILNAKDSWTFRDLFLGCETERRLRAILSRNEDTKPLIDRYIDAEEKTSILSELDTHLRPFRPIVACWSRVKPLSLREWVEGSFVLLLPYDDTAKEQILLLDSLIFEFLVQQLLGEKTNEQLRAEKLPERRSFIYLDELREVAGRLPGLTSLLTRGRAYGIACDLGYGSQSGMKDALDQNRAPEVVGMCNYVAMLRVIEPETADYLAKLLSERQVFRESPGSDRKQLATEPVRLPSTFSELEVGEGYFLAGPPLGLWKAKLPRPVEKPRAEPAPLDFEARPESDQYLAPWTAEDLVRLKLPLDLLDDDGGGKGLGGPHPPQRPQAPPGLKVVKLTDRRPHSTQPGPSRT